MDLAQAANYFNDIPVTDAYSGASLFYAQLSSSLDRQPDGSISKRRIISVAPGTALPTRRAATWLGETWLLGDMILDGLQGIALRANIAVKKATDSFAILTPGQAALASGGTPAYGQKEYLKDTVNSPTDAEYDPFWEISFGANEPVLKGTYLRSGSTLYFSRSTHQILEGFVVTEADQIDYVSASAVFAGNVYDPIADAFVGGGITTTGLMMDSYMVYQYLHPSSPKMLPGDQVLVVAQSAVTPVVGQQVTAGGRSWRIEAVNADQDAWNLHIRGL